MLSDGLARTLARFNIHYGWVVAGTTFLVMLATAGAMGSAGVLIQPLEKEFGWTTEQISSALAARLFIFGLLGPFAAAFMNHFGLRKVVTTALVLIGAGVGLSMLMRELWQMMVLWGIVIGVGTGMTALVLGAFRSLQEHPNIVPVLTRRSDREFAIVVHERVATLLVTGGVPGHLIVPLLDTLEGLLIGTAVLESAVFGARLHLVVADAASAKARLARLLTAGGNVPYEIAEVLPSLEDVFIHAIASTESRGSAA